MSDFPYSQSATASVEKLADIAGCETELRLTVDRLTRANDTLKRVVLVTGHDLQEPIRTINDSCEQILEKGAAPATVESILRSVTRLSEIVQALLSYCVVTAAKEVACVGTCLEGVCQEVEFRLAAEIGATGARIMRKSLPTVCCDRDGIVQVFKNLIGNGIKYRRHDAIPVIDISADRTENEWLITVKDNGIGFDLNQADRIFEPFCRLHGNEIPGTGIGLTICRSIVEQHGGRIWARNSHGSSSTFCFTLPCRDSTASAETA
jgi:light-regulated signal transduction histidine kinase (bacteriophytochrome)